MNDVSIEVAIQNSEKVYAGKKAFTSTDASQDLSALNDPLTGLALARTSGVQQPMLMLQADQDFWYKFEVSASTAVTNLSGSNVGVKVLAGQQEYVRPAAMQGRTFLHVLRDSANGTVAIHVVKISG